MQNFGAVIFWASSCKQYGRIGGDNYMLMGIGWDLGMNIWCHLSFACYLAFILLHLIWPRRIQNGGSSYVVGNLPFDLTMIFLLIYFYGQSSVSSGSLSTTLCLLD
jgi:hypothetical protein